MFDGVNAIGAGVLRARGMQVAGVLLNLRWVTFIWRAKERNADVVSTHYNFSCCAWFYICHAVHFMLSVSRSVSSLPSTLASNLVVSGLDSPLGWYTLLSVRCGSGSCGLTGRLRLRGPERGLGGQVTKEKSRTHKDDIHIDVTDGGIS